MNFYSITIVRPGDCLRSVRNISEIGDCLITDKKLALKNAKYITIDNEEFVFIDLTDEISLSNYMKVLVTKGNFYFYIKRLLISNTF